jgi:glycosyl transferase family 25
MTRMPGGGGHSRVTKEQNAVAPIPAFLMSLPGSAGRRARALALLDELGLTAQVMEASDGTSDEAHRRYATGRARMICGRALSRPEVGCFLSHRHAAQAFVASGAAMGLVVEDDVASNPSSPVVMAALRTGLPDRGWDLVNLGESPAFLHRTLGVLTEGSDLVRAHYFPLTTHAILWSREGAQRFLKATRHIDLPVDHFLRRWCCRSGRGLAVIPAPFATQGVASDIDRDPERQRLVRGRTYRARRRLRRWRNKAWAGVHRLAHM